MLWNFQCLNLFPVQWVSQQEFWGKNMGEKPFWFGWERNEPGKPTRRDLRFFLSETRKVRLRAVPGLARLGPARVRPACHRPCKQPTAPCQHVYPETWYTYHGILFHFWNEFRCTFSRRVAIFPPLLFHLFAAKPSTVNFEGYFLRAQWSASGLRGRALNLTLPKLKSSKPDAAYWTAVTAAEAKQSRK